jgi:NADP-reducing hydrogenase subunit HndB
MPGLNNREDLNRLRAEAQAILKERTTSTATIFIGMGTCGIAAGASDVAKAVRAELATRNLDVQVIGVGCIGMCVKEPLVDIQLPGKPRVTYANVKPEAVGRIIDEHLVQGQVIKRMAFAQLTNGTGVVEEGVTQTDPHRFA